MEPLPGGVPTVAGRTPIACQNCANAKTGCDKRVPCSRCAEKNLPCAARFARRSPKAAVRAAQATAAYASQLVVAQGGQPPQQPQPVAYMDVDPTLPNSMSPRNSISGSPTAMMQDMPMKKNSPSHSHGSNEDFPSPHSRVEGLEDFMQLGNDFSAQDPSYQDLLVWPEYPLELDMYANPMPIARPEMPMPTFTDMSDLSSGSEPMTASSSRGSIHTRGTSIMSTGEYDAGIKSMEPPIGILGDTMIPEFEVVIAAEAAWPLARCNPPIYSGTCPRTAIVHLECLEQKSKADGTWSPLEKYLEQVDWDASDLASVVPLTSRTRDKMLAIAQSFLHKALEIHRGGLINYPKPGYASPGDFNFIVLPPTKILEYFLRSYVRSLSYYFPLVVAGCVDPNEMLINNQASTLLVLLMIAQGAAAVPMAEARYLAAGLTETCRISLFDIIEKDVELSADPVALRCALLFTILGAWSGDKWQMDISMGQRGMYLSVSTLQSFAKLSDDLFHITDAQTRRHVGAAAFHDTGIQQFRQRRVTMARLGPSRTPEQTRLQLGHGGSGAEFVSRYGSDAVDHRAAMPTSQSRGPLDVFKCGAVVRQRAEHLWLHRQRESAAPYFAEPDPFALRPLPGFSA